MAKRSTQWFRLLGCLALATGIFFLWQHLQPEKLGDHFAYGNGRIEATEIDIAAKTAGRIKDIVVPQQNLWVALGVGRSPRA